MTNQSEQAKGLEETKMEDQLTLKEAIEQGYECALSEDGDYYIELSDITDELDNGIDFYLGSKDSFKFSISEKQMQGIIENHIENQDEVNNEPEQLYDQIANIDYKKVCEIVNEVFTTDYHNVTSIKLIK